MTSIEVKEALATNITRFFTLLLFSAGVMAGMASSLLIGEAKFLAIIVVVGLACLTLFGLIINIISKRTRDVARLIAMGVFVSGVIFGHAIPMLTNKDGALATMILLITIICVYGIWIFRPKEV